MAPTWRATETARRRQRYLDAAAHLFARRGYHGVSVEDLGAAAGVSGPALYRHFSGKGAVLADLLLGASRRLLAGARAVVAQPGGAGRHLEDLVAFHVDFALAEPDVIRVQERDLDSLEPGANREVRSLQRRYVRAWSAVLADLRPDLGPEEVRLRLHATFGLLNSTPRSAASAVTAPGAARAALEAMALAALLSASGPGRPAAPAPGRPGAGAAAG